jgi:hypothetical protein
MQHMHEERAHFAEAKMRIEDWNQNSNHSTVSHFAVSHLAR